MSLYQERIVAVALVFSRIAAFVAISPFPGPSIAATQRVGLAVSIAMLVGFSVRAPEHVGVDVHLVAAAVSEIACGLAMGATFRMSLAAADFFGAIAAQAVGLSTPSVMNPTIEAQDTPVGRLVSLVSVSIAIGIGVHREALAVVLQSFDALPLGAVFHVERTALGLSELFSRALEEGLRLGLPALAISLITQWALAMVARAAPQLQIFNVGLTVIVGGGLMVLASSLDGALSGMATIFARTAPALERVLEEGR